MYLNRFMPSCFTRHCELVRAEGKYPHRGPIRKVRTTRQHDFETCSGCPFGSRPEHPSQELSYDVIEFKPKYIKNDSLY